MIPVSGMKKFALLSLAALLACGCGISASYRPADQKTIRDFSGSSNYRKKIGIVALANQSPVVIGKGDDNGFDGAGFGLFA